MRPSVRSIARSSGLNQRSRCVSPFVCTQCQRAALRSPVLAQTRHASSDDKPKEKLPYTERFRRKMWGTDNPPGQKDPYTKASPEEMERLYEEEARLQEEERVAAEEKRARRKGLFSKKETKDVAVDQDATNIEREVLGQLGHKLPVGDAQATFNPDEIDLDQVRAPSKDELVAMGYQPAETWHGLARIGGRETQAQRKRWAAENPFFPFIPSKELPEHMREGLVHRALVEVLTLKEAGLPLTNASHSPRNSNCEYTQAEIVPQGDGYALSYSDEAYRQEILRSMVRSQDAEEEIEQHADALSTELTASQVDLLSPAWHGISLDNDVELKFALVRRTMHLTGLRFRDPTISSFKEVGDIVATVKAKPKPTKIYDILMAKPELRGLPNVQIRPNKYSTVGKDMEFGRRKVIVAELAKRGLRPDGRDLKVEVNVIDMDGNGAEGITEEHRTAA